MSQIVKLIECINTWQGECIDAGRQMLLCRFKYCNLSCKYCDTLIKMRISKEAKYDIDDLQKEIIENNLGLLCTGGEPTIEKHIDDTITLLNKLKYPVANVETNGYGLLKLIDNVKDNDRVKYIYSPKIFNKKDLHKAIELIEALKSISENVYIKIVYENNPLINKFLEVLFKDHQWLQWNHRIWLMPEGITRDDLLRNSKEVFDACEKYKCNFSSRMHIMFEFI